MNAFSLEVDDQGVAVITVDLPGGGENRITRDAVLQIEDFLNRTDGEREIMENDEEVKAVVLISGKEDNFISGADVSEFLNITSVNEGRSISLRSQEVLSRVEKSRVPFVAAIHGACLGLGLEIALACAYRISTDAPETTFGFPEVQLGLIPAGGGTQRLPRLVGTAEALRVILTGKSVNSRRAIGLGLADEMVPREILLNVAKERAFEISTGRLKPKRPWVRSFGELVFEKNPVGRKIAFNKVRKKITNKTHGDYIAPLMALEAMEVGMSSSFNRGLHVESVYFGELVVSDASRHLINLFLDGEDIKKDLVTQNRGVKPKRVEKIAVVGAGPMGSEIAAISADVGVSVRLKDKDMRSVGEGLRACHEYFDEMYRRQDVTRLEMEKRLNLISGTSDYTGFRRADLVIEAVPEDLELKQRTLEEVESVTNEDSVFAFSTSSLPIAQTAGRTRRPGNVIGMHFFSPAHKTPLLEIVVTGDTSERAVAMALEFGKRLRKTPIVVNDGVGFYTTRILVPYLNEAIHLLGEGATVEDVDAAMVQFGFPTGPLTLLDEIGIDVVEKIGGTVHEAFGERLKPPSLIKKLVQDGRMGMRSKRGFYNYNGKRRVDASVYKLLSFEDAEEGLSKDEIQERLSLSMVNEALLCLEGNIVRGPRDGDVGAVLGVGFPPFLGGPFRYVDSAGAGTILKKLESLASKFSPRFTPAGLLRDLANKGKKFYGSYI